MDGITSLTLTLGDIVLRLDEDPSLLPARRRDLISAVRRVCKIVGVDPNATPASMQYMRPLIKQVWPVKHGLRPKTWPLSRSCHHYRDRSIRNGRNCGLDYRTSA
jgi:hypothetical protein